MEKIAKKAYWVGSKDDLQTLNYPENPAELVFIDADLSENKAKSETKFLEIPYIEKRVKRSREHDILEVDNEQISRHLFLQRKFQDQYRADLKKFLLENKGKKVYIVSASGIWRPGGSGYTTTFAEAGIYDMQDAYDRSCHTDYTKCITYKLVK